MSDESSLLEELSKLLSLPGEVENIRKDVSEWIESIETARFNSQLHEIRVSLLKLAERVDKLEQSAKPDPAEVLTPGSWDWALREIENGKVVEHEWHWPMCSHNGFRLLWNKKARDWGYFETKYDRQLPRDGWRMSSVPHPDTKPQSDDIAELKRTIDRLQGEVQRAREVANAGMSAIAPGSFMWAVEQMREGETVRRPGRNVISPDKDGCFSTLVAGCRGNLPFWMEDFYATDWEVVTDGTRVAREWE